MVWPCSKLCGASALWRIPLHIEAAKQRSTTLADSTINAFTKVIFDYVKESSGLKIKKRSGCFLLSQLAGDKSLKLQTRDIENVIRRFDPYGSLFLQINFFNGSKILLTQSLVGFKPIIPEGLDPERLPRVVTTVDLLGVLEAIEESANTPMGSAYELESLIQVYESILAGGEAVGFDLSAEKKWPTRLTRLTYKPSA